MRFFMMAMRYQWRSLCGDAKVHPMVWWRFASDPCLYEKCIFRPLVKASISSLITTALLHLTFTPSCSPIILRIRLPFLILRSSLPIPLPTYKQRSH
ncbi:hypothetical protein GQ43DRAFT_257264 [Delitschia confertaspora ATCC 74209]|uniref:Uncharacterized protein n=1 Tax=Delitschia confertaspora ATCC 74209 TaxID=1513339 RepID=A0A9P4JBW8_9PLEO|nr:hypothetical protein GQ43DRAFT_257264 [Delitschia confertaspora ATCC 74209]